MLMFSLLIGQMCLEWEQQRQIQEEGAVFWITGEHGEMLPCTDHIHTTSNHICG